MVDREAFRLRLARLEELLSELRAVAALEQTAFLADSRVRAAAERWLQLTAECALDLAHHFISDQGWRTPGSYRDAFRILAEHGILTAEHCAQLEGWAGLRNVLVHMYMAVDYEQLWRILREDLREIEEFGVRISEAADRA